MGSLRSQVRRRLSVTGNASPLRLAEAHIARVVFGDRPHALARRRIPVVQATLEELREEMDRE